MNTETHTGRPIIRQASWGGTLVLCPHGHLVHYLAENEWAGSWLESRVTDPNWTVECHGKIGLG